jgi:hypothetical protein
VREGVPSVCLKFPLRRWRKPSSLFCRAVAKTEFMALPQYFSELAPFRDHFCEGFPTLCYHKIEPVPVGARIKGLYLEPALFRRQIQELAGAGFSFSLPGAHAPSPAIAITFDDGFVSNLEAAVPILREFGARAINYLVADRIGQTSDWETHEGGEARPLMDDAQVRDWLAAGSAPIPVPIPGFRKFRGTGPARKFSQVKKSLRTASESRSITLPTLLGITTTPWRRQ